MAGPVLTKKPATYADLEALEPHLTGQLLDGELFATRHPDVLHARVTSTLGMELGGPFQRGRGGPGGWWILDEPELHLGPHVLVPDLAGWRTERMRQPPSTPASALAPDWVCEVLSPSTASIDRVAKKRISAREGVQWCWLIDPEAKTLEAYQLENGRWVELGTWSGEDTPRVTPFEAIELQLSALWSLNEPAPSAPGRE